LLASGLNQVFEAIKVSSWATEYNAFFITLSWYVAALRTGARGNPLRLAATENSNIQQVQASCHHSNASKLDSSKAAASSLVLKGKASSENSMEELVFRIKSTPPPLRTSRSSGVHVLPQHALYHGDHHAYDPNATLRVLHFGLLVRLHPDAGKSALMNTTICRRLHRGLNTFSLSSFCANCSS
jgi:hypothetical protein